MEASLRLEHSLVAVETEQRVHVMVELRAPEAPAIERAPLDVALVVDRSGSMGGDKLEAVKACGAYLARRMSAGDRLSVVAYDDTVDLIAPLSPVELEALLPSLAALFPGGCTNLSGGPPRLGRSPPRRRRGSRVAGPPIRRPLHMDRVAHTMAEQGHRRRAGSAGI